jgi:hypothetical protein
MAAAAGNVNKMEAVRQSLSKLGKDAKPAQIQADVKATHGIELATGLINNYKYHINKSGKKRGRPVGSKNSAPAHSNGTPKPATAQANGIMKPASVTLADILAVKELTQRMGAKNLVALVELIRA